MPAGHPEAASEGWSVGSIALVATAAVLVLAIGSLVYMNFLAPGGNASGTPTATSPWSGIADADDAVCQAAEIFNDIQSGPVQRLTQFMSTDDDSAADEETRPMLIEIGEASVEAGELLTDLRYPKNPDVVQDLRHAFVGYGEGAANLVTALGLPRAEYQDQWLGGLQQLTDGKRSLEAANDEIERMEIGGDLEC